MNQKSALLIQKQITVEGIVQGVGFRPYVFRLANRLKLKGTVLNDSRGVEIVLQGSMEQIDAFIFELQNAPPPLARIDELICIAQDIIEVLEQFSILKSEANDIQAIVAVSADKSTCQDCLDEINSPANRHYHYPFTNCTNCGPRYTIINQLPYDRHLTSMATFSMCDDCAKAYHDPLDRRYHAQPVSCPACGPQLRLYIDNQLVDCSPQHVIKATVDLLAQGKIIALKGLGGFHLICDATNEQAVATLRQRKHRPAKPLAVMVPNISQAKQFATGTSLEWQVLTSAEKPITLLNKLTLDKGETPFLAASVAPGIDRIGLFLPYTPLHHLILEAFNKPIVATSANRSGEPIIGDIAGIFACLADVVDAIVDHNRPIANACDDSVVQVIHNQLQVIRLARGFAPLTLSHGLTTSNIKPTLAVGAQQKNTIALAFNRNMILSPHIGDLFSIEADQYFKDNLATFKRLYQFSPRAIVSDHHPDYSPSIWAKQFVQHHHGVNLVSIQHHYAHIMAVMAANQYQHKVIGFSFDGTGLGEDDALWGSEVMLADTSQFTTLGHFSSFKLIGGEQAIKQPVRILLSLLFETCSLEYIKTLPIKAIKQLSESTLNNLHKLWLSNHHCIPCRSVGRLFDALAVALELIDTNQFEGQAGMMIESQAAKMDLNDQNPSIDLPDLSITPQYVDNKIVWQSQLLFSQIINIISQAKPLNDSLRSYLCHQFIEAIAEAVNDVAQGYPQYPLVLAGGVFQNKRLLHRCLTNAETNQHQVLPSQYVPVNDGGIALGQLWYGLNNQQNENLVTNSH
ncbi:carbamoyltransferase HypF [Shewanella subflava]|uniref:Carbamoyltransferase HypF n=1 Tax=Shewanella subflava TaxID=2986476 RepID=A0ABT3ICK8_9GAMM|nr:carbamoyltransferase HypF [Shewanella subflava]MCW3173797.1 carbamoyltransferase HypF [Shewanella subflava]